MFMAPPTSAKQALIEAFYTRLNGNTRFTSLVTGGLHGHVSDAARTTPPYLVFDYQHRDEGQMRSMGLDGGSVMFNLDGFSSYKGAYEMNRIQALVRELCHRQSLPLKGYQLVEGSLVCEFEDVFAEPDEDKLGAKLYHGVQRWAAEIDEAR